MGTGDGITAPDLARARGAAIATAQADDDTGDGACTSFYAAARIGAEDRAGGGQSEGPGHMLIGQTKDTDSEVERYKVAYCHIALNVCTASYRVCVCRCVCVCTCVF